jgi:hypothetical protein
MGLLEKHPTNSITFKPTSTPFPRKKNQKGEENLVVMRVQVPYAF